MLPSNSTARLAAALLVALGILAPLTTRADEPPGPHAEATKLEGKGDLEGDAARAPSTPAPEVKPAPSVIAVLEFEQTDDVLAEGSLTALVDAVRSAIVEAVGARMSVMTRNAMSNALPPSRMRELVAEAEQNEDDIGRLLGAHFVVFGRLQRVGSQLALTLTAVQASDGKMLGQRLIKGPTPELLLETVERAVPGLASRWLLGPDGQSPPADAPAAPQDPSSLQPLAILDFSVRDEVVTDPEADAIADTARIEAGKELGGRFRLLTREEVQELVPPERMRDLFDKGPVAIGRAIVTPYVLSGSISLVGGRLVARLDAHETGMGRLIGSELIKGGTVDDLVDELERRVRPAVRRWFALPGGAVEPVADAADAGADAADAGTQPQAPAAEETDSVWGTVLLAAGVVAAALVAWQVYVRRRGAAPAFVDDDP